MAGRKLGQPEVVALGEGARVDRVILRPLTVDDEPDAMAAHRELAADDFDFLLDRDRSASWSDYLDRLERTRLGIDLPEDRVPATFLVAEVDRQLAGRVSLRHELTPRLANVGGHIGYGVRPAFRRRGLATAMLTQALRLAADLGLGRVLLTCDDGNTGSAAVIERCGGVLENTVPYHDGRERRYWLPTR